jgi:hypothetical protein
MRERQRHTLSAIVPYECRDRLGLTSMIIAASNSANSA